MEDCAMAGVSEGIYRTGGPSANENEMNKKCHSGERDLAVSSASSNLVSNLVEGLKKCFYFSAVRLWEASSKKNFSSQMIKCIVILLNGNYF